MGAIKKRVRVAFVSSPLAGWKAVRARWDKALAESPEIEFHSYHWEDYAGPWKKVYDRTGKFEDIWWNLATRKACLHAIKDGISRILLTTQHNAYLVPRNEKVVYFIYGDATAEQLSRMQKGKPASMRWRHFERLLRYKNKNFVFLCMSNWYSRALQTDLGISPNSIIILRQGVDTDFWKPTHKPDDGYVNVAFMGRDFEWKGGNILRQLARMSDFSRCRWHYITSYKGQDSENEIFYNNIKPNSSEIVEIVSRCDLSMLPTRADCSPNAVIEALACGLPVITAHLGAIPEMVTDGYNGYLVSERSVEAYGSALKMYIENRGILEEHKTNARETALLNFSMNDKVAELLRILKVDN